MRIKLLRHIVHKVVPKRWLGRILSGAFRVLAKARSDENCRSSRRSLAPERAGKLLQRSIVGKILELQRPGLAAFWRNKMFFQTGPFQTEARPVPFEGV